MAAAISSLTSKEQVTISSELAEDPSARLRDERKLSDLYGALRSTQHFPGKEALREEVGQWLGERDKTA